MKARIVIGSNYGDEGKGTVVASYTRASSNVLNVLTNGGAQRGHSVLTDIGDVTFQHFGAGTYHGADSYYSRYFILNPMKFVDEYGKLLVKPAAVYRDPACRWSTPYDSMANSIEEELRGRHASCRMGIWNTVKRYRVLPGPSFDDFVSDENALLFLQRVKEYYERLVKIPSGWRSIWDSPNIALHFLNDCRTMQSLTKACSLRDLGYDEVIFENGQGLLLCDNGRDTSDTTPSNTGIAYALELLKDLDADVVTAHYVTRPYLTRHGDGFVSNEMQRCHLSSEVVEDRTNHFNDGQGEFRYGALSIRDLKERILADAGSVPVVLELTHCDELDRVADFQKIFQMIKTYDSPLVTVR